MFNIFNKIQDEPVEDQIKEAGNYPSPLTQLILQGLDCDSFPNSQGEFGRTRTNPIPVNGPFGEIKYLNRLRTDHGVGLLYHRIASAENIMLVGEIDGNVDIFETVSSDNKVWDILFFHMYHPRRSTMLPQRYRFAEYHEIFSKLPLGYGSTAKDNNFPYGIPEMLRQKGNLGAEFAKKLEDNILKKTKFTRSNDHVNNLARVIWHA